MGRAGGQGPLVPGAVAPGGGCGQLPERDGGLTDPGRQFLWGKRGTVHPDGGMRQPWRVQAEYGVEHQLVLFGSDPAAQRIGSATDGTLLDGGGLVGLRGPAGEGGSQHRGQGHRRDQPDRPAQAPTISTATTSEVATVPSESPLVVNSTSRGSDAPA